MNQSFVNMFFITTCNFLIAIFASMSLIFCLFVKDLTINFALQAEFLHSYVLYICVHFEYHQIDNFHPVLTVSTFKLTLAMYFMKVITFFIIPFYFRITFSTNILVDTDVPGELSFSGYYSWKYSIFIAIHIVSEGQIEKNTDT